MEESTEKLRGQEIDKNYDYDALVVLGAVMEWNRKAKKWEFPTVIERYPGKLVEGKARAIAASELQNIAPRILVTGGSDINPETGDLASRAYELAKLIEEKYDVPHDKLVIIGKSESGNTRGNVENIVDFFKSNPELTERKKIAILAPNFQLDRAKFMFNDNPYFNDNNIEINFISVEDVLGKRHPLYKNWAEKVYKSDAAKVNREMERKGLSDLKNKNYK